MKLPHFDDERIVQGPHYPMLSWHRPGDANKPLLLMIPGGGHLARVYYGDPAAEPGDFLAYWLGAEEYELLALSYPSDHPANPADCANMTISQWAEDCASAVAAIGGRGREVVAIVWSMAGRLARPLRVAAKAQRLACERMISLAATPQLVGLTRLKPGDERLTAAGLWDSGTRHQEWLSAIADIDRFEGRAVLDTDRYERLYRCHNPIGLRGEPRASAPTCDVADLIDALRPFDYSDYPLAGAIIPGSPADGRHALTDHTVWGYLNAQMLSEEAERRSLGALGAMSVDLWGELRELVNFATTGLSREVEGNHFFFIGEIGARATAEHISNLLAAMGPVVRWRQSRHACPETPHHAY